MSFDPERLRALAKASQARDEENAQHELAQFKSERLAAFSEWLSVELERVAGFGSRSVVLRFDPLYFGRLGGKAAFNEPVQQYEQGPGWHAYLENNFSHLDLPEDQVFWVGPHALPIDRVAGCVIESAQQAGITATMADDMRNVEFSW
jgi:hypothetical protein